MPPNRATSGFLPLRTTLAWKHLRGPCGVSMVAWCLRAIFVTVEREVGPPFDPPVFEAVPVELEQVGQDGRVNLNWPRCNS